MHNLTLGHALHLNRTMTQSLRLQGYLIWLFIIYGLLLHVVVVGSWLLLFLNVQRIELLINGFVWEVRLWRLVFLVKQKVFFQCWLDIVVLVLIEDDGIVERRLLILLQLVVWLMLVFIWSLNYLILIIIFIVLLNCLAWIRVLVRVFKKRIVRFCLLLLWNMNFIFFFWVLRP